MVNIVIKIIDNFKPPFKMIVKCSYIYRFDVVNLLILQHNQSTGSCTKLTIRIVKLNRPFKINFDNFHYLEISLVPNF